MLASSPHSRQFGYPLSFRVQVREVHVPPVFPCNGSLSGRLPSLHRHVDAAPAFRTTKASARMISGLTRSFSAPTDLRMPFGRTGR
jgi:hypothetical protein